MAHPTAAQPARAHEPEAADGDAADLPPDLVTLSSRAHSGDRLAVDQLFAVLYQ